MPTATFHFPRGFLWGAATASHQVEGNNTNNDWSVWEQEPGRIRGMDKAGLACDWWSGRWREDFDRAAEGGQNAHRLSIEWSRIQPAPDRWDENALDRYREIVRGLQERGLTALVTLHHFTLPIWLAEKGGWLNSDSATLFAAYARRVVEALREYVNLWVTINEPNVLATSGYVTGEFPPGHHSDINGAVMVMTNMVRAHAAAYKAIHALQPTARVGVAHHHRPFTPAHAWSPLDRLVTALPNALFNDFFPRALSEGVLYLPFGRRKIPEAKGTQDFFGLNYYTRVYVNFSFGSGSVMYGDHHFLPGADLSDNNFMANDPHAFFESLKWAKNFNLPIIITENGVEDADDHLRPRYLVRHLHQLWRAVNLNYPIKGYFHWTLVDNFEWERGWSMRFGLWELDTATQARRKRPSADLYAEICRENGISTDMVSRYAPEVVADMFPG
jgi:beta-glucosidase